MTLKKVLIGETLSNTVVLDTFIGLYFTMMSSIHYFKVSEYQNLGVFIWLLLFMIKNEICLLTCSGRMTYAQK